MSFSKSCQSPQQLLFYLVCAGVVGILCSAWRSTKCFNNSPSYLRDARIGMQYRRQISAAIAVTDVSNPSSYDLTNKNLDDHHVISTTSSAPSTVGQIRADNSVEEIEGSHGCVKTIHIFAGMDLLRHVDELKHVRYLLNSGALPDFQADMDCATSGFDCKIQFTLGRNISMIRGKDAVVFGMIGTTFRGNLDLLEELLALEPEPGQTWIYYSTEPPYRLVRWSESLDIPQLKYHILMTYHSASEVQIPFGYYRPFNRSDTDRPNTMDTEKGFVDTQKGFLDSESLLEPMSRNRSSGLISWVASNCKGVFWPRAAFVKKLQELISVDDYGTCGHKECLPKRSDYCNNIFASYKFFLALPNSECDDYVTEKFWMMSLKYGVVPVVVGARKENYERIAPPNSFVHASDFESIEALADYLKRVDAEDNLYREYHAWRLQGEVVMTFPIRPQVFCKALPYMHVRPTGSTKRLGDSPWYASCRTDPDRKTIKLIYRELENWSVWK